MLLDSGYSTNNGTMGEDIYKWSNVNFGISGSLLSVTSLLEDNTICDDASGLQNGSYGGSLKGSGCTSNQYITSKVRLLTETEYRAILNRNLPDLSWLYGNKDFYLQTAVNVPTTYDGYGNVENNHNDEVRYINASNRSVGPIKINSTPKKNFRYVITVNSKYILNY